MKEEIKMLEERKEWKIICKDFFLTNKIALLISLFGFIFLFSFNFTWSFITGDDIAYLESTEGFYFGAGAGGHWDMARPGNQIFYRIGYFLGQNNPFWFYLIKDICFFVFLFFFYKIAMMLFEDKLWTAFATFFVMLVYPVSHQLRSPIIAILSLMIQWYPSLLLVTGDI